MASNIISILQIKCKNLKQLAIKNNDIEKINVFTIIENILNQKYCFMHISPSSAISIICDLGFNKDEAVILYSSIIKEQA